MAQENVLTREYGGYKITVTPDFTFMVDLDGDTNIYKTWAEATARIDRYDAAKSKIVKKKMSVRLIERDAGDEELRKIEVTGLHASTFKLLYKDRPSGYSTIYYYVDHPNVEALMRRFQVAVVALNRVKEQLSKVAISEPTKSYRDTGDGYEAKQAKFEADVIQALKNAETLESEPS